MRTKDGSLTSRCGPTVQARAPHGRHFHVSLLIQADNVASEVSSSPAIQFLIFPSSHQARIWRMLVFTVEVIHRNVLVSVSAALL